MKTFVVEKPFSFEPYMSDSLLNAHYNLHHCSYMKKLEEQINVEPFILEELLIYYVNTPAVFNNLAQIYNHNFFWKSLSIKENLSSKQASLAILNKHFNNFLINFEQKANSLFASGWCWLIYNQLESRFDIQLTHNAQIPYGIPILVLDLWEHAYYLDHLSSRSKFIKIFIENLINWNFVYSNLEKIIYNLDLKKFQY